MIPKSPDEPMYLISQKQINALRLELDPSIIDNLCSRPLAQQAAARAVAIEWKKINPIVDEIISMSENLLSHLEENDISYLNIKKSVKWIHGRAEHLRSQSVDDTDEEQGE